MIDFRKSALSTVAVAGDDRLAADRAAGLCPAEFGEGENIFPALPQSTAESGEGQQKRIARCPACAAEGRDKNGKHLVIFPGGKFTCIRFAESAIEGPDRLDHLKRIWKMAGGKSAGMALPPPMPKAIREKRLEMADQIKKSWIEAKSKYAMSMADWQAQSADLPGSPEADFRFAASLYQPGQLAWFGHRFECAAIFPTHLFEPKKDAARAWEHIDCYGLDHTFGNIFRTSSTSRAKSNWNGQRYLVIEHDDEGIEGQIALTRYLQSMGVRLLLAISTGNRGIHSWFDATSTPPGSRQMIAFLLEVIGGDKSAFLRSATRTPGAIRQNQFDGKPHGSRQPIVFLPTNQNL